MYAQEASLCSAVHNPSALCTADKYSLVLFEQRKWHCFAHGMHETEAAREDFLGGLMCLLGASRHWRKCLFLLHS